MAISFPNPTSSLREFLLCHVLITSWYNNLHFSHAGEGIIIPISWKQKPRLRDARPLAPDHMVTDVKAEIQVL